MPLVAGILLAAALGVPVVVGTATQRWTLVAVGAVLFAAVILVVQLDTWRRTRSVRNYLRDEIRRVGRGAALQARPEPRRVQAAPAVSGEDVMGAVRLMQAQYTGRLDRMQAALDRALAELGTDRSRSGP